VIAVTARRGGNLACIVARSVGPEEPMLGGEAPACWLVSAIGSPTKLWGSNRFGRSPTGAGMSELPSESRGWPLLPTAITGRAGPGRAALGTTVQLLPRFKSSGHRVARRELRWAATCYDPDLWLTTCFDAF
jgi:hypothetical protein